MGFIVIPGTKNEEHIKQNFDVYDFKDSRIYSKKITM